jgi:hypothetical protein
VASIFRKTSPTGSVISRLLAEADRLPVAVRGS